MESVHKALLLHSEIQWLSRGKALVRLYKLQTELDTFCMQIIITWKNNEQTTKAALKDRNVSGTISGDLMWLSPDPHS